MKCSGYVNNKCKHGHRTNIACSGRGVKLIPFCMREEMQFRDGAVLDYTYRGNIDYKSK